MTLPRRQRTLPTSGPLTSLEFHPLTRDRWRDIAALFGSRGACGGCWCMWWRLKRSQFIEGKGAGNKRAFRRIVETGPAPGILAYAAGRPIGWCAVSPREAFPVLGNSRILKPVDSRPVWSIPCFFVAGPFRRRGVTVALLRAASDHARSCGARIVEGYPVEPKATPMPAAFAWTGLSAAFRKAGFEEVARRSATRPIMRLILERGDRLPSGPGRRP